MVSFNIENLRYKDILDIESLAIEGPISCIVGSSGGGKTTLLRMLNKMISPDSGRIMFGGHDIEHADTLELRRSITMLPQSPVIYDGTVRYNLIIGLMYQGREVPGDNELLKILGEMNLDKRLDDDAQRLSGGEKQRLCLARIILLGSDVYLLDEPSASLDRDTEQFVINHIADFVRSTGRMLVMVTHSRDVANAFADHTVNIEKGRVASG
jgi:putative ABC transport system ATP-binding protein